MMNESELRRRQKFAVDLQHDFEESFAIHENAKKHLELAQEVARIASESLVQAAFLVEGERAELGDQFPCVLQDPARFEEFLRGMKAGCRHNELHAILEDIAPANPSVS